MPFGFNATVVLPQNYQPNWSGCVLWLMSSLGVILNGSTVSQWNDLSVYPATNGNNFTQGTTADQPVYIASDSTVNGKPTVQEPGSGNGRNMTCVNANIVSSSTFTIYIIGYKNSTNANTQAIQSTTGGTFSMVSQTTGVNFNLTVQTSLTDTAGTYTNPNVICATVQASAACNFYQNNSQTPASPFPQTGGAMATPTTFRILADTNGTSSNLAGWNAQEYIIRNGIDSNTTIREVFAYLGAKYKVSVS